MAYNPMFPVNYGAQMFPTQMSPTYPQQPQPQQNNAMVWVQGEAGAKSYLMSPNTTLPLWDSENPVIYLKSTDASGMPSMKVIDYTVRGASTTHTPIAQADHDYVTREELQALEDRMIKSIDELREVKREPGRSNAGSSTAKK